MWLLMLLVVLVVLKVVFMFRCIFWLSKVDGLFCMVDWLIRMVGLL